MIILYLYNISAGIIILVIYVNDIVITRDDHQDIIQLKAYLNVHFHMKDFGLLKYFLGITVPHSPKGLCLFQKNTLLIC